MRHHISRLALLGMTALVSAVVSACAPSASPPSSSSSSAVSSAQPTGTDLCAADPHLARTATALATSPSAVRIALVGDSTRDESEPPTAGLYEELWRQTQPGGRLAGVPTDGIGDFGVSGMTVRHYLDDPSRLAAIRAFGPTLIEISIGINDLRVDQSAGPAATADLVGLVRTLHGAVPRADVLLTVPAALATTDVGGVHAVVGADGEINPPGAAQRVTTALRAAYRSAARTLGYVGLNDVQLAITGTKADPEDPPCFLADQLHPSAVTAARIADTVIDRILGGCRAG